MSSNDNFCTAPQPKIEKVATPPDALPALRSEYSDTALGETLSSYQQKAAERSFDPYGRTADS